MRYVKYGLFVFGALLVVTGILFGYIAATFDPNVYKPEIIRLVAEKTGRTLSLEGDLQLTLFPKVGVRLAGARLSERDSEAEFAGVDELRVALAFLPLLSGQVVVDDVVLDGLRAKLVRYADGTMNIDDLTSSAQEERNAAAKRDRKKGAGEKAEGTDQPPVETGVDDASGQQAVTLDIEGIRVMNAAFSWKDEEAGTSYVISDLDVQTGRIAEDVPTKFDYSAAIRSDQPPMDLRTRAAGTLSADMDSQTFKIEALKGGVDGMAATLTELAMTFSANVEARTATEWVGVRELEIEASGRMGEDTFKSRVRVPNIVVDRGAITVDQLTSQIETVIAAADVPDERGPELQAEVGLRLVAVAASARALSVGQLEIDIDAEQGDNAIKGRLTTSVTGNLQKQDFRLPKLAGKYDVRSPALPMKSTTIPITGAVDVNLKRETVHASAKIRFDESSIDGVFDMKRFENPFFTFDVGIDQLNLDRYTANRQKAATGGGTGGEQKDGEQKGGAQDESPIDLSPLKTLNLDGKLRIGSLIASGVKLSDVRVNAKAAGGKLEINPLLAKLYGGVIRGTVTANAHTNKFTVRQTLSSISIGPLLRDSLDQDLLDGRGTVELDLESQGDTVGALTSTLSGGASIALRDGAVKGINLAQSIRNAGDILSLKRDRKTEASTTEKTDFSNLTASFTIDEGKAHNEDLSLKSPFVRLSGKGDIDIAAGGLDYLANVSLVATPEGQQGKDAADVAGLTIPVRISGPLAALKYELKFSDAIAEQSKQLIEAEKKKLEKKLESELMEKLLDSEVPGLSSEDGNGESATPTAKPEDVLKRQLKKFLR